MIDEWTRNDGELWKRCNVCITERFFKDMGGIAAGISDNDFAELLREEGVRS